jgi:homeobox protein cut-like
MSSIVEQPSSSLFPPSDPRDSLRLSLSLLIQSWSSSSSTILDRSHLSNVSSQLRDAREASLQTRKDLAEATKRFKKLIKSVGGDESATATPLPASSSNTTDHTLLIKETRSLVKAYQDEIDHLTKRCKLSDTAFTDLYFAFYPQIPNEGESNLNVLDPRHVLTMCQSHLDAQANQVQHLLRGMAEIQNEMEDMDVKNRQQHLDTEREWKGKVEGLERKLLEYVKKEDSWNASKSGVKTDDEKDSSGNSTSTSSSSATSSWTKEEREELMRLRREVTEYELEFKGLKNQDITIKKLNAKIEELQKSRDEEIQRELK